MTYFSRSLIAGAIAAVLVFIGLRFVINDPLWVVDLAAIAGFAIGIGTFYYSKMREEERIYD